MTIAPLPLAAGASGALRAATHQLAATGLRLRDGARRVAHTTGELGKEGWSGPAADAFAGASEHLLSAGQGAADLLDRVEAALAAYAGALEVAEAEQARAQAVGLPVAGADALGAAQAQLQATLTEAVREAHSLRHRLVAGTAPAAAASGAPVAATPGRPAAPAPAGEVVLTLSALAALLASPGDPHGAGAVASPVRAALSGPLRHLVVADERGWQLPYGGGGLPGAAEQSAAPAAEVAPQVAAAALLAPASTDPDHAADGWRLPGRG